MSQDGHNNLALNRESQARAGGALGAQIPETCYRSREAVVCNLYSLTRNREAIIRLFKVSHNRAAAFDPSPAIFPGRSAPIVRQAPDGERELVLLSWGFVLVQSGRAPRRVTNVRDDKIRTSTFWRPSFEERRCLVPAS